MSEFRVEAALTGDDPHRSVRDPLVIRFLKYDSVPDKQPHHLLQHGNAHSGGCRACSRSRLSFSETVGDLMVSPVVRLIGVSYLGSPSLQWVLKVVVPHLHG